LSLAFCAGHQPPPIQESSVKSLLFLLPLVFVPSLHSLQDAKKVEVIDYDDEGYLFPVTRDAEGTPKDGKPTSTSLAGIGLREKTIFKVDVYTYGLYLDTEAAKKKLSQWKGKNKKALIKDKKLYEALLKDDMIKSIRLVFCRDVDGEDVEEAFSDSLEPRIKTAAKRKDWDNGAAALKKFRSYFGNLDELEEYCEVVFTWRPGGELYTSINGKAKPMLKSKSLCWALFDVYLGKDPIEDDGKEDLIERLPKIL
jgi:hypothetical protein